MMSQMTSLQALIAFVGAAFLLTITPGLDTALVLRSAIAGGPRRAVFAGTGILVGCLCWGAAVSVGLGALLAASRIAYTILKWVGAAYLIWLGLNFLVRPRESFDQGKQGQVQRSAMASLKQGFLTNMLNPKIGVFYVTFLPQFIPAGVNVALFSFLLACIHVFITVLWFALLISAALPMGRFLKRPRFVKAMDRISAVVFLGFGAKLALSK